MRQVYSGGPVGSSAAAPALRVTRTLGSTGSRRPAYRKEHVISAIELYVRIVDPDDRATIMWRNVDWPSVPPVGGHVDLAPSCPEAKVTDVRWNPYGPLSVALDDQRLTREQITELADLGWKTRPEQPSPRRGIGVAVV